MEEQNYSNHKRYVKGYHFVTFSIIVLIFTLSAVSLINAISNKEHIINSLILLLSSVTLILIFFYMRIFALKAQDRAIRAEENLRHYILTGNTFDPALTISQILALRFAPDEEFKELAERAVSDNLSSTEIKKSIKKWKADNYRV